MTKEEAVKRLSRAIVVISMKKNGFTEMEIASILAGE